jgi:hypothetical protein
MVCVLLPRGANAPRSTSRQQLATRWSDDLRRKNFSSAGFHFIVRIHRVAMVTTTPNLTFFCLCDLHARYKTIERGFAKPTKNKQIACFVKLKRGKKFTHII